MPKLLLHRSSLSLFFPHSSCGLSFTGCGFAYPEPRTRVKGWRGEKEIKFSESCHFLYTSKCPNTQTSCSFVIHMKFFYIPCWSITELQNCFFQVNKTEMLNATWSTITCTPSAETELSWVTGFAPKQKHSCGPTSAHLEQSNSKWACCPGCSFLPPLCSGTGVAPNRQCPAQHFEANKTPYNSFRGSKWEADPWAQWMSAMGLTAWAVTLLFQPLPSSEIRPWCLSSFCQINWQL